MDVKEFLASQKALFVPVRDLLHRMADAGGCSEREAASVLSSCLKQAGEGAPAWYEYSDCTGPAKIDKTSIGRAFFMLEELACSDENRMYDPHIPRDAVWGFHGDKEYDLIHFGACEAYQDYGFIAAEIYDLLRHNKIELPGAGLKKPNPPGAPERQGANVPIHPSQADAPPPIRSPRIAAAFAGLGGWDKDEWSARLKDPPKWLEKFRLGEGGRGRGNAATWNPVAIAVHLFTEGASRQKLDAIFGLMQFEKWRDLWQDYAE